jgi:3-oxoacyl-[acyl-carrier protein] reductase
MDLGLKNKRVVITGASRGLGEEIAKQFFKEGALLTLIARNEEKLKSLIKSFGGEKKGHNFFGKDLRIKGEPTKVAKEIIKNNKKIDVVVHNLGGSLGNTEIFTEIDNWLDNFNFNAGIAIELNNIFGPHMVKNNLGRIVHISSSNALSGGTTSEGEAPAPAYTCAKSFLNMYSKVLGRELAKNNIIVSCVIPGVLKSEGKYWDRLSKNNPELVKNYLKNHHAIGRFGQFSEIAPFVLFMASKHATFAASANLNIDGGYI